MQQTVTALSAEITKSQAYLDRVRANETQGSPIDQLGSDTR
jgi:vacuolar-type H+-ATPase subunit B/Vma2